MFFHNYSHLNHPHPTEDAWSFVFDGYDPDDEGHREALCALGNGYFVTRAATIAATADEVHYPGTYRAGLYNRLVTEIEGEASHDTSLVNLPNWLSLTFRIDGGEWFSIDTVEILAYRQMLDLKHGVLHHYLQFRDSQGRETTLHEQRIVSMAQFHLAGLQLQITAENWSGKLEICSAIDGRITNSNVKRYEPYNKRHLEFLGAGSIADHGIWLTMRTKQSRIEVALAARTQIAVDQPAENISRSVDRQTAYINEQLRVQVNQGETVQIEKIVALYTSRDHAISETAEAAKQAIENAPNFSDLLNAHQYAWKRLWRRCDIHIEPVESLRALRLHIFHILQTVSPHTADLDVGVPSRGWHGEDYRGHIFWDETFVLPFLACRFPEITRAMLLYRYRRLGTAKLLARQNGYNGAMFPWRSASTGFEETPRFQFSLLSGHWTRDHTNLQHHINAMIAYNLCHYYDLTDDLAFLIDYGAELMIEISRFWASIATYNADLDRYEICGVVGPDEYHTAYPDADKPGINNNTYTNVMAAWTLCRTQEILDLLPPSCRSELNDRLNFSQAELDHWDMLSRKMRVVFHDDGILSQYEGFDALKPFDVEPFYNQQVNLILEARGEDVNHYQVAKQADVAMLFFLLPEPELIPVLNRLGYSFNRSQIERTVTYHLQRTAHESSLSRLAYAGALVRCDREKSWQLFTETLLVDISGASSGETQNGIHLGAMAGTLHLLQYHYLGLQTYDGSIHLDPSLPSSLNQFRVSLQHHGNDLEIAVNDRHLRVLASPFNSSPIKIRCRDDAAELEPGASTTFNLMPLTARSEALKMNH
jgi:trehalose/maltose hydrolase-like predicted phosphorylase